MVINDIKRELADIHQIIENFSEAVEWQHAGMLLDYIQHVQHLILAVQGRLFYLNRIQALLDLQHQDIFGYDRYTESYHVEPMTDTTPVHEQHINSHEQPLDERSFEGPIDEFLASLNMN